MARFGLEGAPPGALALLDAVTAAVERDGRVVGLTIGGSAVVGAMDAFSDLDLVVVCREDAQPEVLGEARRLAAEVGPLLAAFTGEHVGEPRLLIALYGPPLLHVDLKFVGESDLESRVEDGLLVWERNGAVTAATGRSRAAWPEPDLQWIEDRFWIWIHYGAAKVGRGELFECLDMLAYLRSAVFGPLLATVHGQRPQGVRRVETFAADAVPRLAATVGAHSSGACTSALHAAIDLYRALRERAETPSLVKRLDAEAAVLAYLDGLPAR